MLLILLSCADNTGGALPIADQSMYTGFDRAGWRIDEDQEGSTKISRLQTSAPVMDHFGLAADGTTMAYTTLAALDPSQPRSMSAISFQEGLATDINNLVPTGDLVIENARGLVAVEATAEVFVHRAAWSPDDPNLIAYTFTEGAEAGVAVVDVRTGNRILEQTGSFLADVVWWEGHDALRFFQVEDVILDAGWGAQAETEEARVGHKVAALRLTLDGELQAAIERPGDLLRLEHGPGHYEDGVPFRYTDHRQKEWLGDDLFLLGDLRPAGSSVVPEEGEDTAVRIGSLSSKGITVVQAERDMLSLGLLRAEREPVILGQAAAVTYFFPYASTTTKTTVTQIGNGYAGGGCNVWTHTGNSKYAIDIQITAGSDYELASAAGTTSSYVKNVTCNGYDTNACAIYSANCGSSYGNYVILKHADGFYTFEAHMQANTVKVTANGKAAAAGCRLGDEGGTGTTSGNKNGCGDHLHFAKQSSAAAGGTSVSASFSDVAVNTGAAGCNKTYAGKQAVPACNL